MLGKCANPSCSASFRRLGDGRLVRLETDPRLRLSNPKTEYFWLCPTCSAMMSATLIDVHVRLCDVEEIKAGM
jgi:hypothetical protein